MNACEVCGEKFTEDNPRSKSEPHLDVSCAADLIVASGEELPEDGW